MQKSFTPETLIISENKEMNEESEKIPGMLSPSKNLVQRILNYSKSVEVKTTKSTGVVIQVMS